MLVSCKSHQEIKPTKFVLNTGLNKPYIKLFHQGLRLKLASRFNEAIFKFQSCIEMDPHKDAPHHALSECYLAIKDYENAIIHTEKAAKLDPENIYYIQELAYMYMELKKNNQSIECFKKLIEKSPKNPSYLYDYANVLAKSKKYNDAINVLNKFEEFNGYSEQISITKFQIFTFFDNKKAIQTLKNAIVKNPESAELTSKLIEYYFHLNQYEEAFIELEKLIKIEPKNGNAHHLLGKWHASNGDKEKAFDAFKKCILGEYQTEKKIGLLAKIIKEYPLKKEEHEKLINSLLKENSENADLHALKGTFLLAEKKLEPSLIALKKSLELDPSPFYIWNEVFKLESLLKKEELLFNDTQKALEFFPSISRIWFLNGKSANKLNRFDHAIESIENGISFHTNDSSEIALHEYKFQLAEAYIGKKELVLATEILKDALITNPNNSKLILKQVLLLAFLKKDLALAIKLIDKIIPANNSCTLIRLKGYILFQQKKYNESIELLNSIKENLECKAEVIELIGDCFFKLEDVEKALKYWNKSKSLGRTNKTLFKKINDKKYYELSM